MKSETKSWWQLYGRQRKIPGDSLHFGQRLANSLYESPGFSLHSPWPLQVQAFTVALKRQLSRATKGKIISGKCLVPARVDKRMTFSKECLWMTLSHCLPPSRKMNTQLYLWPDTAPNYFFWHSLTLSILLSISINWKGIVEKKKRKNSRSATPKNS